MPLDWSSSRRLSLSSEGSAATRRKRLPVPVFRKSSGTSPTRWPRRPARRFETAATRSPRNTTPNVAPTSCWAAFAFTTRSVSSLGGTRRSRVSRPLPTHCRVARAPGRPSCRHAMRRFVGRSPRAANVISISSARRSAARPSFAAVASATRGTWCRQPTNRRASGETSAAPRAIAWASVRTRSAFRVPWRGSARARRCPWGRRQPWAIALGMEQPAPLTTKNASTTRLTASTVVSRSAV